MTGYCRAGNGPLLDRIRVEDEEGNAFDYYSSYLIRMMFRVFYARSISRVFFTRVLPNLGVCVRFHFSSCVIYQTCSFHGTMAGAAILYSTCYMKLQ